MMLSSIYRKITSRCSKMSDLRFCVTRNAGFTYAKSVTWKKVPKNILFPSARFTMKISVPNWSILSNFMGNINIVPCETDHSEKLDVEWNFNLECDKPWVSLPNTFCLSGHQTSFKLKVDFAKFQPNSVQVAIVRCLETLRIPKFENFGIWGKSGWYLASRSGIFVVSTHHHNCAYVCWGFA